MRSSPWPSPMPGVHEQVRSADVSRDRRVLARGTTKGFHVPGGYYPQQGKLNTCKLPLCDARISWTTTRTSIHNTAFSVWPRPSVRMSTAMVRIPAPALLLYWYCSRLHELLLTVEQPDSVLKLLCRRATEKSWAMAPLVRASGWKKNLKRHTQSRLCGVPYYRYTVNTILLLLRLFVIRQRAAWASKLITQKYLQE